MYAAVLRQPAYWCNYSKPRMILHSFVSSKYFDLASAGIIGLNVIMMALEYYLMPWVRHTLTICDELLQSGSPLAAVNQKDPTILLPVTSPNSA